MWRDTILIPMLSIKRLELPHQHCVFVCVRMEREIAQLKQRISESEASGRSLSVSSDDKTSVGNCPMSPIQSLNTVLPLTDDRYCP